MTEQSRWAASYMDLMQCCVWCLCLCKHVWECLCLNSHVAHLYLYVLLITATQLLHFCEYKLCHSSCSRHRQPAQTLRALLSEFTFATVAAYWFLWQSHRCCRWRNSVCTQRARGQQSVHADWCAYLFINRRCAPQLCLTGPLSPVSPPEVWGSGEFGHTHTHTVAYTPHSCLPWMSETTGTVKAGGRMKGGVEASRDHGEADPLLISLVRESSGF